MATKYTPWRRKPKVKHLDAGLDTSMSFAVVGSKEKFNPKYHAYKVYKLLRQLGVEVYPVAPEMEKLEKDQVYPNLLALPKAVDAVVPCLPAAFALSIVKEAKEKGIKSIWFQNRTMSEEANEYCVEHGLTVIEGCALKFKEFKSITCFVHPCYWHAKTISPKQKRL